MKRKGKRPPPKYKPIASAPVGVWIMTYAAGWLGPDKPLRGLPRYRVLRLRKNGRWLDPLGTDYTGYPPTHWHKTNKRAILRAAKAMLGLS